MVVLTGGEGAGEGPEHLHSPNVPAWLCGCPGAQPELVPIRGTPPTPEKNPISRSQRNWFFVFHV